MFNLDSALTAANARRDLHEEERRQAEMRHALSSILDPDSKGAKLARAKQLEDDVLFQLEQLKWQRGVLKHTRQLQLLERLSELLAEQGKIKEAIQVCPDGERKAYYQKLLKAYEIDDDTTCDCGTERTVGKNREIVQSNEMILDRVYDPDSDSMKSLTLCRKCDLMNVK